MHSWSKLMDLVEPCCCSKCLGIKICGPGWAAFHFNAFYVRLIIGLIEQYKRVWSDAKLHKVRPKWCKVVRSDSKLYRAAPSGTKLYRVAQSCTKVSKVVRSGNRVIKLYVVAIQSGTKWYGVARNDTAWHEVVQSGTELYRVIQSCTEWRKVVQIGTKLHRHSQWGQVIPRETPPPTTPIQLPP